MNSSLIRGFNRAHSAKISSLVASGKHRSALGLLLAAEVDQIVECCATGDKYIGVPRTDYETGGEMFLTPGVDHEIPKNKIWILPGSGIDSESQIWADACLIFAKKFNLELRSTRAEIED